MKKIDIHLTESEVEFLTNFVKTGEKKAREVLRAHVLLLANSGEKGSRISKALSTHRQTVWRIKKRYQKEGMEAALKDKPRPGQPIKYTIKHETEIAALACTDPPIGRKQWTLVLLEEELKKRQGFKMINRESIRLILKKTQQNHG